METIYRHCIFLGSNYTSKRRRGLHFLVNDVNKDEIQNIIELFSNKKGVSVYMVVTDSHEIESVKQKEPFFKNIIIEEGTKKNEIDRFNKEVTNQIMAIDVLLLLLTQKPLTYDEVMTYLYACYCEYIIMKGMPPFPDKFKISENSFGVYRLDKENLLKGKKVENTSKIQCNREDVIFSKFLNFEEENGIELMNDILIIFYKLLKLPFVKIKASMVDFSAIALKNQKKTRTRKTDSTKPLLIGTVKDLYKTILNNNYNYFLRLDTYTRNECLS